MECFQVYNAKKIKTHQNKTKITNNGVGMSTVYGSLIIPYNTQLIHYWQFRILSIGDSQRISIGIDESQCKSINNCFSNRKSTVNYSYVSSGAMCISGEKTANYGDSYNSGDIVTMILNGKNKTISFKKTMTSKWLKNSVKTEEYKQVKVAETSNGFRMCVFLKYSKDSVALLSYHSNADEQTEKSPKSDKQTIISIQV